MLRVACDSSGHVLECFDRKVRREGDRVAVSARAPVDSQPLATALQCWRFPLLGSQDWLKGADQGADREDRINFGPDCGLRSCLTEVHIFQLQCPVLVNVQRKSSCHVQLHLLYQGRSTVG